MNIQKDYGIFIENNHLLTNKNDSNYIISINDILKESSQNLTPTDYFYLGKFETRDLYVIYLNSLQTISSPNFVPISIREVLSTTDTKLSRLILRGKQLINWHRSSLYCGSCGAPTSISDIEIAKICQICSKIVYPYTHSAIIILIEHNEKILLARSAHFPHGMYSTLAGFIDPGESCENAIVREVYEEVGISVKNIQYFGSQPWPFPNSFMLGFKAQYAEGELTLNDKEIEDAKWFDKENLPILPSKSSIARHLIDSFIYRKK